MSARPIVVCEASPRAPTITVRARAVGVAITREVVVDSLAIALSLAPLGVGAEASEVRATGPGADAEHPTALERGATTSGAT